MAEDNSNDRSQALMRVGAAFPPAVIDITPSSNLSANSPAPMGLMKNVTPGAGAGAGAAAPVEMSASDSVITLLGMILDELSHITSILGRIDEIVETSLSQDRMIADAEARARGEELQDANEAASRVQPMEAPKEDDSPWPVGQDKKEKKPKKDIFSDLMLLLGFGAMGAAFTAFSTALGVVSAAISAFALPVIATVAVLWAGYEIFKRVDWSSFVVPLENAFALVKDVALSMWDIFGKVVDVIEVSFMPIMRFLGDTIANFLQPIVDQLAMEFGRAVELVSAWWVDSLKPMVDQFGEGLVTVKNFFKGIQDLRGAELRQAIVGGFMKMIDSLWDAMANSKLGNLVGMKNNEEKRVQEFETRREEAREQHTEREGEDNRIFADTGIMALPENERAAARAESEAQLERELSQIASDESAANAQIVARDGATDAAIGRGEAMADTAGPIRQGLASVGVGLAPQPTSGDAYAGLTIKASSGATQVGGGGQATDGGPVEPGVIDFASMIQGNVGGFTRFTGFNDNYHQGLSRPSKHKDGLAMDFTVDSPSKAAAATATVKKLAADAGVPSSGIDVINEYANPSSGSSGGHIHAEFNTKEAAMAMAGGGLDSSPMIIPGAPAGAGPGARGTGTLTAQSDGAVGPSRSGAGVAAATARHASQTAAAPTIVTNISGSPATAVQSVTNMMPIPIPIHPGNPDPVIRALQSVGGNSNA